jgi:hypothetical protein
MHVGIEIIKKELAAEMLANYDAVVSDSILVPHNHEGYQETYLYTALMSVAYRFVLSSISVAFTWRVLCIAMLRFVYACGSYTYYVCVIVISSSFCEICNEHRCVVAIACTMFCGGLRLADEVHSASRRRQVRGPLGR